MTNADRIKYLQPALFSVGLIFIVGIYPLTIIWPSGWSWHTGQSDYLQMILGIYATLGVFLADCFPQPARTLKSHLVHGVVQRCSRRHHGGAVGGEPGTHGTSLGRCVGAVSCGGCACHSDATTCGGKVGVSEG